MRPTDKPRREGKEPAGDAADRESANRTLPDTDMQPEDAGSAASGSTGRGTAAEGAMKQTSKTSNETGSRR